VTETAPAHRTAARRETGGPDMPATL
jgi:hypothetical protein